jgi:IclR family mhp operon transcriptional activator
MEHSATRALAILESLNRRPVSYVREIAQDTGISKPSIVRLLAILAEEGYVQRVDKAGAYAVTARVQTLSAGFHEAHSVIRATRPRMDALTAKIAWPLALGVMERRAMVIRYSTIPKSPMAWYQNTFGARLSLGNSGMGQAVLAFLPEAARNAALEEAEETAFFAQPHFDQKALLERLAEVRARGYAVRAPGHRHRTTSISVPILVDQSPVAGLSVTLFGRAMTPEDAGRRFAAPLQQLASEVACELASGQA